jgi:hypothetical protein
MIGKTATFEEIQNEISKINLGEFLKFCGDFNMPIPRARCHTVFKRSNIRSNLNNEAGTLVFDDFKTSLPKILIEELTMKVEEIDK